MVDPAHDVAVYGCPARQIVQVHGHHILQDGHEVVEIVIAHHAAALRPVAPDVKGAAVAGFPANVMHLVELEQVVVAPEQHRRVRRVVHQVVRHALPHPADEDGRTIGADRTAEVVEMIVDRVIPARCERLAVAPAQDDPVFADIVYLARDDPVVRSRVRRERGVRVDAVTQIPLETAEGYAGRADIPQRASCDEVVMPARYFNPAAARTFEYHSPKRHMRSIV